EELGITAEQEAKLKAQREEFRDKNKKLMEKMLSKRKELKQELEKPNINRAKVDKIIADIKNLTGEKLRSRVHKIISMKNVLTQEQFEKLQKKMEEKRQAKTKRSRNKRWFRR
ncbi:MAG: periplasmic heavy metal sensor, partial [Candidatus Omnitrophica bacterium]|nr:periplasmic heavy metal sensor [Candidatus Omnitrophota bacterium]